MRLGGAQLAITKTRIVTTVQLFLPYAVTADGKTLSEYSSQHAGLLLGDRNSH